MRKRFLPIISTLSLLVLVIIQVYIINSYYKTKSNNFDMIYSRAILGTVENNEFSFSIDSLDIVLNESASSYLMEIPNSFETSLMDEIWINFDSLLKEFDPNPASVKEYLHENKLDTVFKTYYNIKEISLLDFNIKIPVNRTDSELVSKQKSKGIYIRSSYKEGDYYAIQYDYYTDFTHKSKIILSEMKGLLVMIILTISAVIVAFIYTMIALQRQKKLSELKDEFIDNITHEFKTPLSTISVATSSLKQSQIRDDDQKFSEVCTILEKQNRLLNKMISNVIDVSLLERKKLSTDQEPVRLKDFLHEVIGSFADEDSTGRKAKIKEDFQFPDDFEYVLDPVQMTRALKNLLNNSVKYCETDPVINVSVLLNEHLKIKIEDNGIGIKEEHVKNVFNKFFRASQQTKVKGLGLGLYIVKRIIEYHRGTVQLQSTWGKGTTVILTLPTKQ